MLTLDTYGSTSKSRTVIGVKIGVKSRLQKG